MDPCCFICGAITSSTEETKNFEGRKFTHLLMRICKLLNLTEILESEWNVVTLAPSQRQHICCINCCDLLTNVEKLHQLIVKTEKKLKTHLEKVDTLVTRSEARCIQSSLWGPSCIQFRKRIIEKAIFTSENVTNDLQQNLCLKEENNCSHSCDDNEDNYSLVNHESGSNLNDPPDSEKAYSPPYHQLEHTNNQSQEKLLNTQHSSYGVHQNQSLVCHPHDIKSHGNIESLIYNPSISVRVLPINHVTHQQNTSFVSSVIKPSTSCTITKVGSSSSPAYKRRKIIVIAEEDEQEEENMLVSNNEERTSVRAAKTRAESALKCVSACESDNDDIDYDDDGAENTPVSTDNDDDDGAAVEDSSDDDDYGKDDDEISSSSETQSMSKEHQNKEKVHKKKKKKVEPSSKATRYVKLHRISFLAAKENLFIYNFGTFVRKTYTHLHCLAYNCTYQTEFDYFPSFQLIRKHIENTHRTRKHRQKSRHPCSICNTLYENQHLLKQHLRAAHREQFKYVNQQAVCESCLTTTKPDIARYHAFQHKNVAEKALAREMGDGNKRCFVRSSLQGITEKNYVRDWEMVTKKKKKKKGEPSTKARYAKLNWIPFLAAEENLYIYNFGTFIRKTYTHLHCLAYNCTYQTEFDYFSSFQLIRNHIEDTHRTRKHRQRLPHPCVLCNTLHENQHLLQKHLRAAHPDKFSAENQRTLCESCLTTTKNDTSRYHAFQHKNEAEKAIAKAIGDGNKRCFVKRTEKTIFERKHVCNWENCTAAFKTSRSLTRHKRSHLPREQRTDMTKCPECGDVVLKEYLSRHMQKIHHPETVTKVLVCPICDKRYHPSNNSQYEAHIRRHRGEKPFLCTECGAAFSSRSGLSCHTGQVHKNLPIQCEWCGKVYTKSTSLIEHIKRHHPERRTCKPSFKRRSKFYYNEEVERALKENFIGPIQKFACPICDTVCVARSTLKRHMMRKHENNGGTSSTNGTGQ